MKRIYVFKYHVCKIRSNIIDEFIPMMILRVGDTILIDYMHMKIFI